MALGVAILMVLLISTIISGMLLMSSTESAITGNFRDEQVAFFAGKGGIEEVRDRLRPAAPGSLTPNMPIALPGNPSSVVYITNPLNGETVAPWNTAVEGNPPHYPDDQICKELGCVNSPAGAWYTSFPANASYATTPPLPWKWVRLMAKPNRSVTLSPIITTVDGASSGATIGERVCWNGSNEVAVANTFANCQAAGANYQQVYELTALAVGPGGSRRMVQLEAAGTPPISMPAAVGVSGFGQRQCQLQGGIINGNDQASPPLSPVAGIAYSGSNAGCPSQGASITGGGNCTASPNICGNVSMSQFSNAGSPSPLSNTIGQIEANADQTYTGNVPAPQNTNGALGVCNQTTTNPKTTVIKNSASVFNGVTGCGILLIEFAGQGQLQIDGNMRWNGPVIVYCSTTSGQVQVQIEDGSGFINGALMMASAGNTAQFQFQFQTTGFAGGIKYNSYYNNIISGGRPLLSIAFREVIY